MKIHHTYVSPHPDTTAFPPETLQDERLTPMARGILGYILSFPDGTDITADALWQQSKGRRTKRGEGRECTRQAFAELEKYGYLVRRRTQNAQGRVVTELELYDTPGHVTSGPAPRSRRGDVSRGEYLYRHLDDQGRLLYVGVTNNPKQRERGHSKNSPWIEFRHKTTMESYPSRAAAEEAETAAIESEQPVFNVAGNVTSEARQRLVDYLAERDRLDLLQGLL